VHDATFLVVLQVIAKINGVPQLVVEVEETLPVLVALVGRTGNLRRAILEDHLRR
jgi:hypothetical protein